MKSLFQILPLRVTILGWIVTSCAHSLAASPIKVLIIDGQNNHDWAATTPVIKEILKISGYFEVDVCTSPKGDPKRPTLEKKDQGDANKEAALKVEIESWKREVAAIQKTSKEEWSKWRPKFSDYQVVVSNYNGEMWPDAICREFETYVAAGGGCVAIHAADNSFSKWDEYNKMMGIGGWGGRDEKSGPMLRLRNGAWVKDTQPGKAGTHGAQVATMMIADEPTHPIMRGLPDKWMHVKDEIYGKMRGPAENVTVLAHAFSDSKDRGTGEFEPMLMVISYGKGRVFHTMLGHAADQMKGTGFRVTLQRGTEWDATGKVTQPLAKTDLTQLEKVD